MPNSRPRSAPWRGKRKPKRHHNACREEKKFTGMAKATMMLRTQPWRWRPSRHMPLVTVPPPASDSSSAARCVRPLLSRAPPLHRLCRPACRAMIKQIDSVEAMDWMKAFMASSSASELRLRRSASVE